MTRELDNLDDAARQVVEAALSTAGAFGDTECGTEYLLYGAIATGTGDVAELAELFALTGIRLERAIVAMRADRFADGSEYDGDPQLTRAALDALATPRRDGDGPTGVFEILSGILAPEESGAATVLRQLGVAPEEFGRLVTYGTWHLSKDEADALLNALDRREATHLPWWGPAPGSSAVEKLERPVELAKSRSAVATLDSLERTDAGISLTISVASLETWILDPVLQPIEHLVAGRDAPSSGPDLFRVSVVGGGIAVSNDRAVSRWRFDEPPHPVLVPLGHRVDKTMSNDRRAIVETTVVSDWWIWPLPTGTGIEIRIDWLAEVLHGCASVRVDDHSESLGV